MRNRVTARNFLFRKEQGNASSFSYVLGLEYPRLPLMRELSAKLTEGETLDSQINIFAYTAKIAVNIEIANSHYR